MSEVPRDRTAAKLRGATQFAAWSTICFIVLSLLLSWLSRSRGAPDLQCQIRAGILRDVISEMPIGRQALVSSPWVMPLPTICAFLFAPLLEAQAYGLAYLYGLALTVALATIPLASLLRRAHIPLSRIVSIGLLAVCAYAIGSSAYSDLLACVSCLLIALFFETHSKPVLRALAGVFYGLALFSHPVGFIAVAVKLICILSRRLLGRSDRERRAVHCIQCFTMAYVFCVYLFLNWMIMQSPLWSLQHSMLRVPASASGQAVGELAATLTRRYAESAPVVSGHLGYVVEPILRSTRGHHFVDFHRDKVPSWEKRELLLVVPKDNNPLVSLCDIAPALRRNPAALSGYLLLTESPHWEYYLIVRQARPD